MAKKMTNDELDALAIEYKTASGRKKDKIYLQIAEKYNPYIKKRLQGMPKYDAEDVYQIYQVRVIKALNDWEQKASFATYLFGCVRGSINEWVRTHKNKMYRDGLYHILISDLDEFTRETVVEYCSDESWGWQFDDFKGGFSEDV